MDGHGHGRRSNMHGVWVSVCASGVFTFQTHLEGVKLLELFGIPLREGCLQV